MSVPTCETCENRKHYGFSRDSLQVYCGMGEKPSRDNADKVSWIPHHWSRSLDKMVLNCKTSPHWCPLRKRIGAKK